MRKKRKVIQLINSQEQNEYVLSGRYIKERYVADFFRPWGDHDPEYPKMSVEIMTSLFEKFQVVTRVCFFGNDADKKEWSFPEQYKSTYNTDKQIDFFKKMKC